SETKADMEGDFKMTYEDAFLGTTIGLKPLSSLFVALDGAEFNAQRVEEGHIEVEMIQPQHIALGTSIQLLPNIKVNVDMKWVEYSKWEDLTISFDQNVDFLNLASIVNTLAFTDVDSADPNELRIPRGYEDVLSWAFGVEYQANDSLVLRFGYEPRGSAVPDDKVDFLFPIADANLYSFGFGYQIDSESRMDFAIAYLVSEYEADLSVTVDEDGKEIASNVSTNANSITPGDVIYNPYAYLPIEGKTEAYLITLSYDEKF
ncbi:MAG: outer membrane protein transport protein, partial [Pseudomonadales bacterium]|nr:outer membrane protein transport protein [Pseudomonadales bacterium]